MARFIVAVWTQTHNMSEVFPVQRVSFQACKPNQDLKKKKKDEWPPEVQLERSVLPKTKIWAEQQGAAENVLSVQRHSLGKEGLLASLADNCKAGESPQAEFWQPPLSFLLRGAGEKTGEEGEESVVGAPCETETYGKLH